MKRYWKETFVMLAVASVPTASPAWGKDCGGKVVCECGDIVVEDYKLPADLFCSSGGLSIGANVTLNGQGHRIVGSQNRDSFGIQFRGQGSQVKNIEVSNFERCVRFRPPVTTPPSEVRDNVIKSSELHHCGFRIGARPGSSYGVDFAAGAIENTVKGNWIHDNFQEGVHLGGGSAGNRVIDNLIENNGTPQVDEVIGGAQIGLVGVTTGNIVVGNVLSGGEEFPSVRLTPLTAGSPSDNLFKENTADSLLLVQESSNNEFRENTFRSVRFVTVSGASTKTSNNLIKEGQLVGGDPCIQFENATDNVLQEVELEDCASDVLAKGTGTNTLVEVESLDPAKIVVQDQAIVLVCDEGKKLENCQEFTAP